MALFCSMGVAHAATVPAPSSPYVSSLSRDTVVLGGGCFWGVQAVFQHLQGVEKAVSGYAGGDKGTATYNQVSEGDTGHAEVVEVTYNPAQINLGQILQVFFAVAHDPTEKNRQGPDVGTQYRSAIFTTSPEQATYATKYIAEINESKIFDRPIATLVEPLKAFYKAEDYHQDYATLHPNQPYILIHDAPKLKNLEKSFPALYKDSLEPAGAKNSQKFNGM